MLWVSRLLHGVLRLRREAVDFCLHNNRILMLGINDPTAPSDVNTTAVVSLCELHGPHLLF